MAELSDQPEGVVIGGVVGVVAWGAEVGERACEEDGGELAVVDGRVGAEQGVVLVGGVEVDGGVAGENSSLNRQAIFNTI